MLETLYPGGPPFGDAHHVHRSPPAEAGFAEVDHVDLAGDPRAVLIGHSDASLVVVGCHHRGHLAGMWAGSTTEWLLVRPPVPLVIARHGHRTETAAICVDGSAHAEFALRTFLALPWSSDVEVSLVSVADGPTDVEEAISAARAAFPAAARRRSSAWWGRRGARSPASFASTGLTSSSLARAASPASPRMTAGSTVSALVKDETANLLVAHVAERPAVAST